MINQQDLQQRLNEFNARAENTQQTSILASRRRSVDRLETRYHNNNEAAAIAELNNHLRGNQKDNEFSEYSPGNGVGIIRAPWRQIKFLAQQSIARRNGDCDRELVLFWKAANDQTVAMSTVETRRELLITALAEAGAVCSDGFRNKIAEKFVGAHPLVELIFDVKTPVLERVKGFAAKILSARAPLIRPEDFENHMQQITEREKEQIRREVIECIGLDIIDGEGRNYLTQILDNLEDLALMNVRRADNPNGNPLGQELETLYNNMITTINLHSDSMHRNHPPLDIALRNRFIPAIEEEDILALVAQIDAAADKQNKEAIAQAALQNQDFQALNEAAQQALEAGDMQLFENIFARLAVQPPPVNQQQQGGAAFGMGVAIVPGYAAALAAPRAEQNAEQTQARAKLIGNACSM